MHILCLEYYGNKCQKTKEQRQQNKTMTNEQNKTEKTYKRKHTSKQKQTDNLPNTHPKPKQTTATKSKMDLPGIYRKAAIKKIKVVKIANGFIASVEQLMLIGIEDFQNFPRYRYQISEIEEKYHQ